MDWVSQVLMFGFLALALFIGSLHFESEGRRALGAFLGGLELLPAVLSSMAWAEALRASGKADWLLLGLLNYPLLGMIFWCMLGAGVFAAVRNVLGEAREKNGNGFVERI